MGHKRTIRPNAKRLSALFMERDKMDWDTFSRKVKACQRGFMGEPDEMRPGRGEFHEFPHSCICQKPFNSEKQFTTKVSRADGGFDAGQEWENQDPNNLQRLKQNTTLGDAAEDDGSSAE